VITGFYMQVDISTGFHWKIILTNLIIIVHCIVVQLYLFHLQDDDDLIEVKTSIDKL